MDNESENEIVLEMPEPIAAIAPPPFEETQESINLAETIEKHIEENAAKEEQP